MAEQLVANLAEPFDPTRYTDDYRANLMKVIKAKMKGKKAKLEEPEVARDSGVLDLMSRLRASLEEGSGKKGAVRAKRKAVAAGHKPAKPRKRKSA
jgi:DNA end-binding protein Ku